MPKETEKNIIKKSVIEALEPFANSVQKDFQKVHKRLDSMDGRLYAVEERLTGVERDVQWMKENSSALFTKLDKFIMLYEKHEQELLILSAHVRKLEERIVKLEANQKSS